MNHRSISLAILLSAVGAGAAFAEDAAAGSKAPAYVLKKRSAFSPLADDQRAPFWPIGWCKRKPVAAAAAAPAQVAEAPKMKLDARNYKVTSILLGNPSLAIINGRTYSEGEFLRTPRTAVAAHGGAARPAPATTAAAPVPRIRIYRITDGNVVLQGPDQYLTVPLLRPELAQRRGEEELLLEDRP